MIKKILQYTFIGSTFLTSIYGYSQEQLPHTKKMYVGEDQKLYVHESMPIYLFMSTTPDVKDAKRMHSKEQPKHSNPMSLDGHGIHYMKHQDDQKEVEVKFEIYADGIAPKTKHDFNGAKTVKKKGIYYGKNLSISLKPSDEMSGIEDTYFSINGEPFQKYTSEIPCTEEGKNYKIQFYSTDHVGNIEKVKTINVTVDSKSPNTSYKIHGDSHNNIISNRSKFSLNVDEKGSGNAITYFSVDGGKDAIFKDFIYVAYLLEGEHSISYYSIDNAKNKEEKKTYNFFLDKTAPMIVKEIMGDRFIQNGKEFQSGRSKVKLTSIDNKAGVKEIMYSINGEEFQPYSTPFYLPKSKSISIEAYAVDFVNNTGKSNQKKKFIQPAYVDLSGPNLKHKFHGKTFNLYGQTYISDKTQISLTGYDSETGLKEISYQLNGQNTKKYISKISFQDAGKKKINYTGYDNVNNSNEASFEVIVDKNGPNIEKSFSIESQQESYPAHTKIYLSATDKEVGTQEIYYSINGGLEKTYSSPISNFQKGKNYQIKIRAIDQLKNESILEFEFKTIGDEL